MARGAPLVAAASEEVQRLEAEAAWVAWVGGRRLAFTPVFSRGSGFAGGFLVRDGLHESDCMF